jgi:hypothetical protein
MSVGTNADYTHCLLLPAGEASLRLKPDTLNLQPGTKHTVTKYLYSILLYFPLILSVVAANLEADLQEKKGNECK